VREVIQRARENHVALCRKILHKLNKDLKQHLPIIRATRSTINRTRYLFKRISLLLFAASETPTARRIRSRFPEITTNLIESTKLAVTHADEFAGDDLLELHICASVKQKPAGADNPSNICASRFHRGRRRIRKLDSVLRIASRGTIDERNAQCAKPTRVLRTRHSRHFNFSQATLGGSRICE